MPLADEAGDRPMLGMLLLESTINTRSNGQRMLRR